MNLKKYFKANKADTLSWYLIRNRLGCKYGGYISPYVKADKGIKLPHDISGVFVANYNFKGPTIIHQNVTIGLRNGNSKTGKSDGFLFIGAGAFIGADVSFEENVIVGANAVVTKDVPANSVVIGNNKIIANKLPDGFVEYEMKTYNRYVYNNPENNFIFDSSIWKIRDSYDETSSKSSLVLLKKEYKELLKTKRPRMLQRLIWSKLYRLFTGKWLKTK